VSSGPLGVQKANKRTVARSLFSTKLDAILAYFATSKEQIGFAGKKVS
jgi:hypothetical protein